MSVFDLAVEKTPFYTTWADGKDESRPENRTGQNLGE